MVSLIFHALLSVLNLILTQGMYLIHLFPTPSLCMCIAKVHPSSSSDSRQVQFSELQKVADENNAACIESSAKDDVNVGELLFLPVQLVHLSTFLWD